MDSAVLDRMIAASVLEGKLAEGFSSEWARANAPGLAHHASRDAPRRRWTAQEEQFVRDNLWLLGYERTAGELGRSVPAVMVRTKKVLHLPGPTADPRNLSASQVANLLGMENKLVHRWRDAGLMPFQRLTGGRYISSITRREFLEWLSDPDNWVHFDFDKVAHAGLKAFLERRRQEWGDEWWTARQAADFLGITTKDLLRHRQLGRIEGRQVKRSDAVWGFWYYRKSQVTDPATAALLRARTNCNRKRTCSRSSRQSARVPSSVLEVPGRSRPGAQTQIAASTRKG